MSVLTVRHLKAILEDMPEDAEINVRAGSGWPSKIDKVSLTKTHNTFATPETASTYVTLWLT